MLKDFNIHYELLEKYEEEANIIYNENFVSKENVLQIANKAQLCDENIKLISDFMDFADDKLKRFIWLFYYVQFKTEENFANNIWELDEFPMPCEAEQLFPGCLKAVLYLLASKNLEDWAIEKNVNVDEMMKNYFASYRNFVRLNQISHKTYALCRYSPFLYAYAKPTILVIGRLTFQLLGFKNFAEMYENENGERLFAAMPNYTYNLKGLQDAEGFVPEYTKKGDILRAHIFKNDGSITLKPVDISLNEYKLIYKPGDQVITIHIPGKERAGKLTKEAVKESIIRANEVLTRVFPPFKGFVCTTWFLDPALRGEVIKDGSNLADFADIFDIICGNDNNNHSLFEHVFNTVRKPLDELKPENSFQERILNRAKRGEKIYWSLGVLKKGYLKGTSKNSVNRY